MLLVPPVLLCCDKSVRPDSRHCHGGFFAVMVEERILAIIHVQNQITILEFMRILKENLYEAVVSQCRRVCTFHKQIYKKLSLVIVSIACV